MISRTPKSSETGPWSTLCSLTVVLIAPLFGREQQISIKVWNFLHELEELTSQLLVLKHGNAVVEQRLHQIHLLPRMWAGEVHIDVSDGFKQVLEE